MKNALITFIFISISLNIFAQLPNTDIWLMNVRINTDTIIFSDPDNITNRVGYDNQPAFSPDGSYILYTSIRDEKQSDIYKYDLKTKSTIQITKTKTSEYSPTFMTDGKNVSVVMVESDSTQRLWKFPINGGKPSLIMKNIDSIGYYCWINNDSLALIMITEPPTLQIANVKTEQTKLIATNVSRCIQPKINKHSFYYLRNNFTQDSTWQFTDSYKMRTNDLSLPANSQDYYCFETAEIPPIVIYACNNVIWGFYKDTFEVICRFDMSTKGISKISRITMSKDGKKIAIVSESK